MHTEKTNFKPSKTVLVLGGNGFIGRHIVKHLEGGNTKVLIGTSNRKSVVLDQDYRYFPFHRNQTGREWKDLLNGVDTVVNSVGILRETPFKNYEQVHHRTVASLAKACATHRVRLVHVSILGANNPTRSSFASSKLKGENAVRRSDADWVIVRPSLVDGIGGNGAKWFRRVAAWPVHFAPANAVGGFSPIDADDLGEAIANIVLSPSLKSTLTKKTVELGGDQILTVFEYLELLNPNLRKPKRIIVPAWISRLVSHVCDVLHVTPFSFGHYELLQYRNYPIENALASVLGRPATTIPRQLGLSGGTEEEALQGTPLSMG